MTFASPWPVVPLEQVAETALGKMLDAGRPKGAVETPYLRNLNVQWGRIDTTDVATVALSEEERARFAVHPGDLLVCEGGAIGRAAIWHGPAEIGYQKALHRVRSRGDLDLRWLRYLLEQYDNQGVLAARATGSTIKHLPQSQLRQLPIPMPNQSEQRRIVDILEDHLSRLAAAEEGLKRALRRALAARGSVLDAFAAQSLADSGVAGLHRLGDIIRPDRKIAYGVLVPGPDLGEGTRLIRIGDLRQGRIVEEQLKRIDPEIADKFPRSFLQGGEVLLSVVGTIGRTAVVPHSLAGANVARAVAVLPVDDTVDPHYLSFFLQSPRAQRELDSSAHEVARKTLNLEDVKRFEVPVLELELQRQRVAEVDVGLDALSRLVVLVERQLVSSAALRRSLLAAAFTGRL